MIKSNQFREKHYNNNQIDQIKILSPIINNKFYQNKHAQYEISINHSGLR